MPKRPAAFDQDNVGEYLVDIKLFGQMQRVSVVDPETGNEASATGPMGRGVEQQLIQIAIGKLRRGISV